MNSEISANSFCQAIKAFGVLTNMFEDLVFLTGRFLEGGIAPDRPLNPACCPAPLVMILSTV